MKNLFQRGVITFVFDDGYQRVYENVLPILERYNAPGVFALPLDGNKLEASEHRYVKVPQKIRNWSEWKEITSRGHEIASHSETHPNLTKIPPAQLEQELQKPAQILGAETFVYPGGALNEAVVAETKKYYKAARTVKRGFETIPPQNPHELHTFNFSRNNFRLWKANLFVLWAWLTNSWMIETYHMVDNDDSQMVHTVKTKDFERHVRFVASLPIPIRTIKSVIKS